MTILSHILWHFVVLCYCGCGVTLLVLLELRDDPKFDNALFSKMAVLFFVLATLLAALAVRI